MCKASIPFSSAVYVDQLFHSANYALSSCFTVARTDRFADAQVELEESGKIVFQNCKQINEFPILAPISCSHAAWPSD